MSSVTFEIIDPLVEEGEYMSPEDPGTSICMVGDMKEEIEMMKGKDDIVIENGEIMVLFNYPMDDHVFKIFPTKNKDYFTRGDLALSIGKKYQQIYEEQEIDGRYGWMWHSLGELVLHEVYYFENNTYKLGVDS